jgi:ubiquinone biosynthesis monooxygenase Coq7
MIKMQKLNTFDRVLVQLQHATATCLGGLPAGSERPYPAQGLQESPLDDATRRESAALVRVDHAGEVCAQALYMGQAVGARQEGVAQAMREAAQEEQDHLRWSSQRLSELGAKTSILNPFWYAASWGLGVVAGRAGDALSLGFVVETERQVEGHLAEHLQALPAADAKSRVVLQTMLQDEVAHAQHAQQQGAQSLPKGVQLGMRLTSKIMTTLSALV